MIAENIAFGILAAAMAVAAIGVVRTNNVVHAALYLVVVLAGAAAQFILLGQEFIAWVQVLVYIGAVIVLFLFGIMLTRAPMHPTESLDNNLRWPGAVVALFLVGVLSGLLVDAFHADKIELDHPIRTDAGKTQTWLRSGNTPAVKVVDPLQGHVDLLAEYNDADIHNLAAYLSTLK